MRFSQITMAGPCAVVLLAGIASNLLAQQSGPPNSVKSQPTNRPPVKTQTQTGTGPVTPASGTTVPASGAAKPTRPEPKDLVVPQLTPEQLKEQKEQERLARELEKVLVEWEKRSSEIKTLHGKHKRTVYNMVFEVEKRSEGVFFLETPDKGRIDLISKKIPKSEVSGKKGKNGTPFLLEGDRPEKWICNGKSVFAVNDEEMTYEAVPIPEEDRGANIVNSPLPFLFGMKVADMKRRYKMTLVERKSSPNEVIIIAKPRTALDLQNYTEAWIMLDKEVYLPTHVKLFDPSGNLETVYQFLDVKVNNEKGGIFPRLFGGEKDPYNPDFKKLGYKLVLPKIPEKDEIIPKSGDPRQPVDPRQRGQVARPTAPSGSQAAPRTGSNPNTPSLK